MTQNMMETLVMEDLRHTAYAYLEATKQDEVTVVDFFNEMDENRDDRISLHEFKTYMKKISGHTSKYGSDEDFFRKLTRDGRDYWEYCDVVTFLYIVNSGRPFCNKCRHFIAGSFFTCVECFQTHGDYNYNFCPSCYYLVSGKKGDHGHCHKEFIDPVALLLFKEKKERISPIASKLTTMKRNKARALELMQIAVGCTSVAVAVSQLCTIM